MTDILADRFFAIADVADDGDWRDVLRRAGRARRRRRTAVLVVAVAGIVTALAVAANGGWIFGHEAYSEPSFSRSFSFHGARWSVGGYLTSEGRVSCFSIGRKETREPARAKCRVYLLAPPGMVRARAITTIHDDQRGGQIWFGDARSAVTRVTITDDRGRTFTAAAVTSPTLPHPTARFRLWLIVLPSSTAITIAAYDSHGKRLYRRPADTSWPDVPTNVH
jgi:hypothetical protein